MKTDELKQIAEGLIETTEEAGGTVDDTRHYGVSGDIIILIC